MNRGNFPQFSPQGDLQRLPPGPSSTFAAQNNSLDSVWGPLAWWLRLTSSGWQSIPRNFVESERVRRSRLASYLFLGLFLAGLVFLTAGASDVPTLLAIIGTMLGVIIACVLNRLGFVSAAGLIVSFILILAVFGADLSAPGGQLSPDYLPSYDILVLAVVVAGSLLSPAAAFYIAVFNSLAIAADFFLLQTHSTDLMNEINQDGIGLLLGRPIGLEIAVAVVAYLWVSGTIRAAQRADQAERVAQLEHAYAQQRQQLEIGVQQILETHVRLANGDFSARAPLTQDNALWQISYSLNNLMGRLQKASVADYQLTRTNEEVARLANALIDLQAGRRPIWPAPSGTEIDQLLAILTSRRPTNVPSGSQIRRPDGGNPYYQTGALPGAFPGAPSQSGAPRVSQFGPPPSTRRPGSASQPGSNPFQPSAPQTPSAGNSLPPFPGSWEQWTGENAPQPGFSGPLPRGAMGGSIGRMPDSQPSSSVLPSSYSGQGTEGFPDMSADEGWPSLDVNDPSRQWNPPMEGGAYNAPDAGAGNSLPELPQYGNPWYLPPEE